MDIAEIKRKFELLKQVNDSTLCLISEISKELKVSKTDLMQFVIDNPKLFHTETKYSYKKESYIDTIAGHRIRDTRKVAHKNLGLGIADVYLHPEDNFRTEEWLQKQINDKAKYIYISEFDNYGRIEGYYIKVDKDSGSKYREHLWRNTEAKLKELKDLGIVSYGVFYFGGFGDCTKCPYDYTITLSGLQRLKEIGWSFNKLKSIG